MPEKKGGVFPVEWPDIRRLLSRMQLTDGLAAAIQGSQGCERSTDPHPGQK